LPVIWRAFGIYVSPFFIVIVILTKITSSKDGDFRSSFGCTNRDDVGNGPFPLQPFNEFQTICDVVVGFCVPGELKPCCSLDDCEACENHVRCSLATTTATTTAVVKISSVSTSTVFFSFYY
jgi:hypothetical protein